MQRLRSCQQRRVTGRATATPKKFPQQSASKSKTAMSLAPEAKTVSSPIPEAMITSPSSTAHILATVTTPVNDSSDVRIGSTTPEIPIFAWMEQMGDIVAWVGSPLYDGMTQLAVLAAIQWSMVSVVTEDTQLPGFYRCWTNSTGRPLQRPFFEPNNSCDPLPLSLVDHSSRRARCDPTSSPTHSGVEDTTPGNQYQTAREGHNYHFIMWMEDDHVVGNIAKLKRPRVLRDLIKNTYVP